MQIGLGLNDRRRQPWLGSDGAGADLDLVGSAVHGPKTGQRYDDLIVVWMASEVLLRANRLGDH